MFVRKLKIRRKFIKGKTSGITNGERGAALAIAIIMVAILSVIALTALAFSSTEARIAGSDLQRTQTFYATVSSMEKMTNDFSNLFRKKLRPTTDDLVKIAANPPSVLKTEGFSFVQSLGEDKERLDLMRATQHLSGSVYPRVNIPEGPYTGLYASIVPYKMSSQGTLDATGAQVKLEREFNNYIVPIFQFGIYSNEDLEFSPGPLMTFNGRTHSNANIYALRNIKFLNRLSMAGEFVRSAKRGGEPNKDPGFDQVWVEVNGINVQSTKGSVQADAENVGGPNIAGSSNGKRGYYPGSPNGVPNPTWESESIKPAAYGVADHFGGQVLTNTTGASQLKTPLELAGNSPTEIIKRSLPSDTEILSTSRYHSKSQIRILIDNFDAGNGTANAAGISAGKGVQLSEFIPTALNGGNVLRTISNTGTVGGATIAQANPNKDIAPTIATTVRAVRSSTDPNANPYVPPGSGIQGRILIEVVDSDGTARDVTQTILSMGVTEGEPNGIVYLQRPLWASLVQGSRDRSGNGFDLVSLTDAGTQIIADGEIKDNFSNTSLNDKLNFISGNPGNLDDDASNLSREATPSGYNAIVPINVYNVREGWTRNTLAKKNVYYDRGITSVVELNMRNLARWLDGVYDNNLLVGTNAVSKNIKGDEGYVVYVSDRRGDHVKAEYLSDGSGTAYNTTNGTVDNEDIYGPNGILDEGEDVIDFGWDSTQGAKSKKGTLQHDTAELPDAGVSYAVDDSSASSRLTVGMNAISYNNRFFRRSVRLFDAEKLMISGAAGKLSATKGITIASENMVYTWGNYNTTGITGIPTGGSTLNNGGYGGDQISSSIVCDAIFPLSKTWFDGLSAMFPEGSSDPDNKGGDAYRLADANLSSDSQGTAVRAALIAGTTISSLTDSPGRTTSGGTRRNGGIANYPRFLEIWNADVDGAYIENAWSYTGSFIPLFKSTQAISQWENDTSVIYMPPRRNWSFDSTYLDPNKLPPGTPFFQYVQGSGFRQSLH